MFSGMCVKKVNIALLLGAKFKSSNQVHFLLHIFIKIDYDIIFIKCLFFDLFHVVVNGVHCVAVELVLGVQIGPGSLAQK